MREIHLPVGAIVNRFSGCEHVAIDVRYGLWVWTAGRIVTAEADSSLKELRLNYPKRRSFRMRTFQQAYQLMRANHEQCDAYLVAENDVLSIELRWVGGSVTVLSCEAYNSNEATEDGDACKQSKHSQQETLK